MTQALGYAACLVLVMQVALLVLALKAGASVQNFYYSEPDQMNDAETQAFKELNGKIDGMIAAHHDFRSNAQATIAARDATIADLQAKLAAVPVPVDNTAEVVAAVASVDAKIDAENPPPAPEAPPAAAS